jgi:MFS transporter, DHA1 family, tetracycline resistance protein
VLQFGFMTALLASGYGVMFTVLDDFRDEYGIAAHWLGLIVGIGFLSGFLSQVFLAPIADRGHAKSMVMLGLALNVVGLLGMAAGESLGPLLIARFISGIGMGMAVPAVRRIVVNEDPDNLGSNLGLLLASDVTGFALGPAISALLVPSFGIPAPFLVIAAATVICLPIVYRVQVTEATEIPSRRFAFDLLSERPMIAALMMGAAVFLMIGTFDALWAIVLDDLHASEWVANIGITLFAIPLIFLSSWGGGLAQRVGPFRLGPLGLILGAGFMFSYGLLPTGIAMFCVGIFHGISDGITVSSTGVAVGLAASSDRQAGAQGMLGAAETLTGGVTAVIAGVLYTVGGRTVAYTVCAVVMVALAVAAFVLVGADYRNRQALHLEGPVPDPASAVTGHA